ncbi:hypothetical protein I4U23_017934 [Adineta vaga]|nr:hypothetical protein I4U23_017934 [Adineta vaga]
MMFYYILILLVVVRSTDQINYPCDPNAVCGCSFNQVSISRIVNGEQADLAAWGWTVSLLISDGLLCGGSIISDSWIITAAHCVYNFLGASITVYAGSNARWLGTQVKMVSETIIHPNFNSLTFANDISLLKLSSPLNMSDNQISTICMPFINQSILESDEWPRSNEDVVTVGWGRLSSGGIAPENLQQVTLNTIDYRAATCSILLANKTVQFCAGVQGGSKDACQGDSGGPLMLYFAPTNQWILAGITSSGRGCALANYSGIYTRVAAYKDWIESFTNKSYWIDMNSHGNIIEISIIYLLFFVSFNFLLIFEQ